MTITTAPPQPAPAAWAVATVLGYLRDEARNHAEIVKRLRYLGDVDRQEEIIDAIQAVRALAATHFPHS